MSYITLTANETNTVIAQCYAMLARCYYALNYEAVASDAKESIQHIQQLQADVANNCVTTEALFRVAELTDNSGDDSAIANDFFAIYNKYDRKN